MRRLKKALSLTLALALTLVMAVPAFAAPVDLNYFGLTITLSEVIEEDTAIIHHRLGDLTVPIFTVPVGSSLRIGDNCGKSISKAVLAEDGNYTNKSEYTVYTGDSSDDVTFVWDETYAGAVWRVNVHQVDGKNFLVKVEGSSTATEPEQPENPQPAQPVTAAPTNDALTLDGVKQSPTVFKLDGGDNYFKIRDLAAMLNGTEKQFAVGYDGSVQVTTGQPYEAVGGELAGAAEGSFAAEPTNDAIYIDGVKADLTAYKIEGNNFFRLRDLGRALDFYVGWTAERGVFIETDRPYSD